MKEKRVRRPFNSTRLKNSLICGFCTVLVSVPLGSILGWLIARSDIPGKPAAPARRT